MDVMEIARQLGEEIQKDDRYKNLESAKMMQGMDISLQSLIEDFNTSRSIMMKEMEKTTPDNEKVEELQKKLEALYQEVMANNNMKAFVDASQEMDKLLSQINGVIQFYVTGEEACSPDACASCGGGCGGQH